MRSKYALHVKFGDTINVGFTKIHKKEVAGVRAVGGRGANLSWTQQLYAANVTHT